MNLHLKNRSKAHNINHLPGTIASAGLIFTLLLSGCLGGQTSAISLENASVQSAPMNAYPTRCSIKPTTPPARPDRVCGASGYTYLLQNYLHPQCGGCHSKNSVIHWNGFADSDVTTATHFARYYLQEQDLFFLRVRDNPFISTGCNLDASDPVYKDLQEWFAHPDC